MTRQDFELIARNIRDQREHFASNTAHARFASATAATLSTTNPRFDRSRFILACMPTAWVGSPKSNIWERLARS
jgi:hypothetical protein